jgi:peptidyl-prolyl cis-trans isomerase B (cyclophilin B)
MRRIFFVPLLALTSTLVLAGCGGDSDSGTTTSASSTSCEEVDAPSTEARTGTNPTEPLDASKTYEVTMETNCGSFTITLDQAQSPTTSASFVALVEDGFYDGTIFHRIVPDFVIQGGDPTATGTGGPGYTTVDTPPPTATYEHGVVAMAKTGADLPGTSGSQFFIVTAADAGLPPEYAIVGTVTEGLDVVDAIGQLGGLDEQPARVVEIEKATVSSS